MRKVNKTTLLWAIIAVVSMLFFMPVLSRGGADKPTLAKNGFTPAKTCGVCHEAIYKDFQKSLISRTFTDPIFKYAYMEAYLATKGEAKFVCLKCHAPTVLVTKDYDMEMQITREGVTCDFCHSIRGVNLKNLKRPYDVKVGKTKWGPLAKSISPAHFTERLEVFSKSEICAGCHEFKTKLGAQVMGTYSEWKAGPYPKEDKQCQDCHMPLIKERVVNEGIGDSKRTERHYHSLAGGHSLTQLKKAIKVDIVRVNRQAGKVNVQVKVKNVGSGHKVPTGIPSRKLVLIVRVSDPFKVIYEGKRIYEKVMVDSKGKRILNDWEFFLNAAKIKSDNRIAPREERHENFTFYAPGTHDLVIEALVEYRYSAPVPQKMDMKVIIGRDQKIVPSG